MPETIRVFVDARPVDVPPQATALDAVRAHDPALADAVQAGGRVMTDSRGLPVEHTVEMRAGSILRVVARREPRAEGRGPRGEADG